MNAMILENDTFGHNEALLFISPSEANHESHNLLAVMTWPLFMIGALLKFIEWVEQFV
jgi:hypothetical protein